MLHFLSPRYIALIRELEFSCIEKRKNRITKAKCVETKWYEKHKKQSQLRALKTDVYKPLFEFHYVDIVETKLQTRNKSTQY